MKFGRNIQNTLEQFAYFSFSVEFVFYQFFVFQNRILKITRILTHADQANAPTLMRCNFFKHTPKLTIFGSYNLHTFKHKQSSMNYC